jgi:uncharacterized protein (TIGR02246 family)
MKKLFMILPLVFLLCFSFSCQKAEEVAEEPVVDVEADVESIKSLADEAMKAFNENDQERYLSLLTEDVTWMAPTQSTVFGKEAVRNWISFDQYYYEIAITVEEVQVFGDVGLIRDVWKGKSTLIEDSEKVSEWINKSLLIVRKQSDGTWKITHAIWNSNLPE